MVAQLWTTVGTTGDDFIIGGYGNSVRNGGEGDDYILGDTVTPFSRGTSTSPLAPASIDDGAYWTTEQNPFIGDSTIAHTTLYVKADADQMHYSTVTVDAGETITIDIDFGYSTLIGYGNTDVILSLYDMSATEVMSNDDADTQFVGGAGSNSSRDSYLTYTNTTGTAQTYLIKFSEYGPDDGGTFEAGQTFIANISVSGHITALTSDPSGDTLDGGNGDDAIAGQGGNDILRGGAGDDDLSGGSGNDTIDGGIGVDDTAWYIDTPSGVTVDLSITGAQSTGLAGTDTLTNIENLVGSNSGDTLTGNDEYNLLMGRGGNDALFGGGGVDHLEGEDGIDSLYGGDGDDVLTADSPTSLGGFDNFLYGQAGGDTLIGWFGNDQIYGGAGFDYIADAGGDDIISGGADFDELSYLSALAGVTVDLSIHGAQVTGAGTDTITGIENLTGSYYGDTLTGDAHVNALHGDVGNDTLSGGGSDDELYGGAGDDTLNGGSGIDLAGYLSSGVGVTVSLAVSGAQGTGEGTDTLISIENLLGSTNDDKLSGNANANLLNGSLGDDVLKGNGGDDTLVGAADDDTLIGGDGNDWLNGSDGIDAASYTTATGAVAVDLGVADAQDTAGAGIDTIMNVENLIGSSYADNLHGSADANRIDGGAGADLMTGRAGADTYIVDNSGDRIVEGIGGGDDTVLSSITYQLSGNYVENLRLTGSAANNGIGNGTNNVIIGNSAANMIDGKAGNDWLTGGGGNDLFRFDTALVDGLDVNRDHITDFTLGSDRIQLDDDIFTNAGAIGTLAAGAFYVGAAAHDASDRIIYDSTTGNLYYDPDGTGAEAQVQFAFVDAGLSLTNSSFQIIG